MSTTRSGAIRECGSQGLPMSLAKRGPRRGASTRFPMQGELESYPQRPTRRQKGPEILSHPHPEEKGQALPFGVLSRCFAKRYQILGVLKGTLMHYNESFRLSTCSIDPKDSAKVQQVTFGPRIGRANLVHPGAPPLVFSCLPGSSDLFLSLIEPR